MTAICPAGGTSSPNTGAAAVAIYSAGLIADLLVLIESPWLIPVIPLLGLGPLTLSSFCGADPPAMPTFTSAETDAILNVKLGANFDSGIAKAKDAVLNAIWQNNCHCDVGAATVPSPPAIPAGTPIFQNPQPSQVSVCLHRELHSGLSVHTGQNAAGPNTTWGGLGSAPNAPINATSARFRITYDASTGGGCATSVTINWQGPYPSSSIIRTDTFALTALQTMDHTLVPPAGAWGNSFTQLFVSGAGSETPFFQIDYYCNGDQAGATQNPCCPPDPSTQAYLDLILKTVTLIQRQDAPFAYVLGPVHAGLSGTGVVPVSGILGLLVELTTVPTPLGRDAGTPIRLFDAGFVNLGTSDGFEQSTRIQNSAQLVIPRSAGLVTSVGYSLHSGVVATITELIREP